MNLLDYLESGFPEPPAQLHSRTSCAAADAVAGIAGKTRRKIFDWLQGRGATGATDEEGIEALGINPSTYRPRRGELVTAGYVIDSGNTRKVKSGLPAVVWRVAKSVAESMP